MKNKLLKEIEEAFEVKYPTYGYILIAPTPEEIFKSSFKRISLLSGNNKVMINSPKSYELIFNMLHKHSWHKTLGDNGDLPFFEPIAELLERERIKPVNFKKVLSFFRNDKSLYFSKCLHPQKILENLKQDNKIITPMFPSPENIAEIYCHFYEINRKKKKNTSTVKVKIIAQFKDLQLAKTGQLLENDNEIKGKDNQKAFKTISSDAYNFLKGLMIKHKEKGENTWISEDELLKYVKRDNLQKTYDNLNNLNIKNSSYKVSKKGSCYRIELK